MAGKWRQAPLGEFIALQRGHDLTEAQRRPGRIPVMGSAGQNGFHDTAIASGPGVVVGRSGASFGKVHYCKEDYWPHNTSLYVTDFKGNDPRFSYYLLSSIDFSHYNSGSAQPSLNRNYIYCIPVSFPEIAEQRAIGCILGALDDKIELNGHIIHTLEAMARALFKSWFLEFGPIRAKADKMNTRLPHHITDIFPDRFENSNLGMIPAGWKAGTLGDIILPRTERVGNRDAVVLSAVASGEVIRSDEQFNKRVYSKEIDKYIAVEQWDFVYNPSRINIGSIGMLKEPLLGAVSPIYVVFRPNPVYRWFVEFAVRNTYTKEWINTLSSGSVRQSLSYTAFCSIPCVIPSEKAIEAFNQKWSDLRSSILARREESRILAALRDVLLPKLLSGELPIPDTKRIAGRCA
jgi:type I restriction enzyme S subunit